MIFLNSDFFTASKEDTTSKSSFSTRPRHRGSLFFRRAKVSSFMSILITVSGMPAVKTSAKTLFPEPVPPQTKTCSLGFIKLVLLNLITAANVVKAALEIVEDVVQVLFFQIRKLCLELCRE